MTYKQKSQVEKRMKSGVRKLRRFQGQSRPYLGSDDLDFDSEVEVARAKATQANETAGA